jgi:hemerythrin-like metal-binding protein
MGAIAWRDMMGVGIPDIDADHRTLLRLTNELDRAIGHDDEVVIRGVVLTAVRDFADSHFSREETLMRAAGYPGLAAHAAAHDELRTRLDGLVRRYGESRETAGTGACLEFLTQWVVEHLCSADMDYRGWCVGRPELAQAVAEPADGLDGLPTLDWRRLSVLLVDCSPRFRGVMRAILEGVGVRSFVEAPDVDTARLMLEATPVDAVVADLESCGAGARDLLHWMRSRVASSRVSVVVLGECDEQETAEIRAAGADAVLAKPVSARRLLLDLARLSVRGGRA